MSPHIQFFVLAIEWFYMYHLGWGLCCMYTMFQHMYNTGLFSKSNSHVILMTTYTVFGFQTELLLFAGKWSSPPTTGRRPPPCSFFSFTAINDHQAVLFGGNQPQPPTVFGGRSQQGSRVNDCFLMDFESMVCSDR